MSATVDVLRAAPLDKLVRLAAPALAELAQRKDAAEKHMLGAEQLVRVAQEKFRWPRELPADNAVMKNRWLELVSAKEDKAAAFERVNGRHSKLQEAMALEDGRSQRLRQALIDLAVAELDEAFSLGTIVSPIPILPYEGALISIPPSAQADVVDTSLWSSTAEARTQQGILANAVRAKKASELSSRAAALMRKTLPKAIDWIKDKIRTKIVSWRLWRGIG